MTQRLYFLAVVPPRPLVGEIREMQEDVSRDFAVEYALNAPPHVGLVAPFLFESDLEEQLVRDLKSIVQTFPTFSIVLHGYGFFEPHTVFLHVLRNRYLRILEEYLHKSLYERFPAVTWKERRRFHPHIALARKDVDAATFFQMYKEFQTKPYHASFAVEKIALLTWENEAWRIKTLLPLAKSRK